MFMYNIMYISKWTSFLVVEYIPLCLKYDNKSKIYIYIYSIEHNNSLLH